MTAHDLEALTAFLSSKHRDATLLLAGSFARGTPTAFSDYDILAIQDTGQEPFRTAYQLAGRLVEVFCHTEGSLHHWMSENTKVRKKSMASMLSDSQLLVGDHRLLDRLKDQATRVIRTGPPPWTREQDWAERKAITEKLDDVRGLESPNEIALLGSELFLALLNYFLVASGHWLTNGKYYRWALLDLEAGDQERFSQALDALVGSKNPARLVALTEGILNRFGGMAYEFQETTTGPQPPAAGS